MALIIPRLSKEGALNLLEAGRALHLDELSSLLPTRDLQVSLSAVGGAQINSETLEALRRDVMDTAGECGFPDAQGDLPGFDARCSDVLHTSLPMTPHEASQDDVWSYLTCAWLLDVAIWRFGRDADDRRFIGDVNRNTFRRLWWRREILGPDIDLRLLGEDELVNIMERPMVSGNPRIARVVARTFLELISGDDALVPVRMQLMREVMKRLVRVIPFIDIATLDDRALGLLVDAQFNQAHASLLNETSPSPDWSMPTDAPTPSAFVETVESTSAGSEATDLREAALEIARNTGRVTNATLREVAEIDQVEARAVLTTLVDEGKLARRGVRRGSHYVPSGEGALQGGSASQDVCEAAKTPEGIVARTASALRRALDE